MTLTVVWSAQARNQFLATLMYIPKTGRSFDYRLERDQIQIQRWYRQRQKLTP